jgi:hypothetical protein
VCGLPDGSKVDLLNRWPLYGRRGHRSLWLGETNNEFHAFLFTSAVFINVKDDSRVAARSGCIQKYEGALTEDVSGAGRVDGDVDRWDCGPRQACTARIEGPQQIVVIWAGG